MIRNEKYPGDALFLKTYTDEHFNRHANRGEEDQYLIKNHHEAIISHDEFDAAQETIEQRGKEKGNIRQNRKCLNRYSFSGKIRCEHCGATFKRQTHRSGRHRISWCCSTHLVDKAVCGMKFIPEVQFEYAFVLMINKLIFGHNEVLKPLLSSLRDQNADDTIKSIRSLDEKLEENEEQRKVLIGLMTKGYLEPPVYAKSNNELLQEAERLQYRKTSLLRFLSDDQQHVNELSQFLQYASRAEMLTAFDAALFDRFVERILVYSRTEIGFELKCGLTFRERTVT